MVQSNSIPPIPVKTSSFNTYPRKNKSSAGLLPSSFELPKECGISEVPKPSLSLKIIGGKESTKGNWPWQVVILNRFRVSMDCFNSLLERLFIDKLLIQFIFKIKFKI